MRWSTAGHLPLFGTYESSLSLAVAVLLGGLLARIRSIGPAGLWPVATGTAAALVAHGLRFDPTPYALTISERSWVVDVHAVLAWAAERPENPPYFRTAEFLAKIGYDTAIPPCAVDGHRKPGIRQR